MKDCSWLSRAKLVRLGLRLFLGSSHCWSLNIYCDKHAGQNLTCLRLFTLCLNIFDLKPLKLETLRITSNSSSPSWFCLIFCQFFSFRRRVRLHGRNAPTPASLPLRQSWHSKSNSKHPLGSPNC